MKDKRREERVASKIIIKTINGEECYYNISANISASGLYFLSPSPYRKGEQLDIRFTIPHSEAEIECKTRILALDIRDGYHGMHTSFCDISEKDREKIRYAIENLIIDAWFIEESREVDYAPDPRTGENRREKKRVPIKIWIRDVEKGSQHNFPSDNISTSGMHLLSPVVHDVGNILTLEFDLPGENRSITARALIVSSTNEGQFSGLGLKFIKLSNEDRDLLERSMHTVISDAWFLE